MRPAVALVLSAVLLAGCTAVPDPVPDPGGPGRRTIPWGLTDCIFLIGLIRFDPAEAQDLLPEGFAFATGSPLGLPAQGTPLERATVGVEAFACAEGAGLTGSVAPLDYGSVYFDVVPPEDLRKGEGVAHFLKLSVLVPDADRRAALESVGADVTGGEVALETTPAGMAGTLTLDTVGTFTFQAVNQPPRGGVTFPFREFTPTADGRLVQWDATATNTDIYSGQGTLEVPPGSIAARLGGGTTLQVSMFGGRYTFENGTITLP